MSRGLGWLQRRVLARGAGTPAVNEPGVIEASRDVGAAAAFDPRLPAAGEPGAAGAAAGDRLMFRVDRQAPDRFVDAQTGSTWEISGHAVAGPLLGTRLALLVHGNHFWFAWAAFRPETRIWRG